MVLKVLNLGTILFLRLLGAERAALRVGPVRLIYYRLGPESAEPWVLLHGLGAVAATWAPILTALRGNCRLLVPELSALGGTVCPGDGLAIRPGAKVIARLLEREFAGRPATVAGISLGGWMAVRLALERPDLVSRLVLIDAGGFRDQDWDTIQELVTIEDLEGVDRLYPALFVKVPWMMRISRSGFLKAYTSSAVKGTLAQLAEEDTYDADDLARLPMPTALIWGERDGLFNLETARAMAAALPDPYLTVLPDCGHAVHVECPGRLAEALGEFRRASSGKAEPAADPPKAAAAGSR
ncbi:MAG TPA: alpha/beta hydrolase [Thermoanaerobaculia bacterium]|nr:alpha/beta hydrolase [Thermoanaerobaculia bacterium]